MAYKPRFSISAELLHAMVVIQELQTRIEQAPIQVSWVLSLQRDALARSAHGTAAIEGNPLTLEEVKTVIEGQKPVPGSAHAVHDIQNVLEVIRTVERLASASQLKEEHIYKIHQILGRQNTLERGPIGAYRDYGVEVGDHKGVHPGDVPKLMTELIDWINGEGSKWPALVTSAVLHFRFEFIHPFGDGNGRVGRAIALWELYRRQFKTKHLFSIEEIFWEKRKEYFAALHRVEANPEHDLTSWLEFVADALKTSLERARARIDMLPLAQTEISLALSPKQERLLKMLGETPMGIAAIQKVLHVTKPGAHHILKPLITNGFIERAGGHKTGVYRLKNRN